jgi:tellurite methyltransferase
MVKAAESVRRYSRFFKNRNTEKVLDYGTGTMRNALFLAREGFCVYAADLPEQVEKLGGCPAIHHIERLLATDELSQSNLNVDLVLSTYVFNIIMSSTERHAYLKNAAANLRPGGYLLMEVRCRKPQERCDTTCKDYFTCAECSKTLTHEELDVLLAPHGLRRISHYYRSHAVAAIYQK